MPVHGEFLGVQLLSEDAVDFPSSGLYQFSFLQQRETVSPSPGCSSAPCLGSTGGKQFLFKVLSREELA